MPAALPPPYFLYKQAILGREILSSHTWSSRDIGPGNTLTEVDETHSE